MGCFDLLSTFLVFKSLVSLLESQMFLPIAIHICKSIFIDEDKVVIHTTNSKALSHYAKS